VRSLTHAPLNDAVAPRDRPGRCGDDGGGGVAAFSALAGDLRHRFRVAHGRQPRSFTAGALAFGRGAGGRAPDLWRRALAVAEQAAGVEREDQGARRDGAPPPILLAAVARRSGPGPWPAPWASSLSSPRQRRGGKRRRGDAHRRGTRVQGRREEMLAGCHGLRPLLRAAGGHGLRPLLRAAAGHGLGLLLLKPAGGRGLPAPARRRPPRQPHPLPSPLRLSPAPQSSATSAGPPPTREPTEQG